MSTEATDFLDNQLRESITELIRAVREMLARQLVVSDFTAPVRKALARYDQHNAAVLDDVVEKVRTIVRPKPLSAAALKKEVVRLAKIEGRVLAIRFLRQHRDMGLTDALDTVKRWEKPMPKRKRV